MARQLLPYEINFLIKHGFDPKVIESYGEMPVEYITGKAEFKNMEIKVTKNTLIPRIETEQLADIATSFLTQQQNEDKGSRVLEIGTGSGALTVYLANRFPKNEFVATDIAERTLIIAKENVYNYDLQNVTLIQSDLLTNIEPTKYDLVIANLPYIPSSRIEKLDESVKEFEPVLALDGGEDGFRIIDRLLSELMNWKKENWPTIIMLEIDETHDEKNLAEFDEYKWEIVKDWQDKNRFAVGNLRPE